MQSTIEDWATAASAQCAGVVDRLGVSPDASAITRARKDFAPGVVACAIELARGRAKARAKWPEEIASRIVGDRDGIEMASSWAAANHKATRFAEAGFKHVVDLCCGIGGDSMGFVNQGLRVSSVDRCELRAWMCAQSTKLIAASKCTTHAADVLDENLPPDDAFHLDPARRVAGRRVIHFEDLEPGPEVIQQIISSRKCGAVKLNPGIDASALPEGELEILSERGRLVQAVLWTGSLAKTPRRATVLDQTGQSRSIHGEPARPDDQNPIGSVIYTMDPSVERADLVPTLIERTNLALVQPGLGLLTSESRAEFGEAGAFLTAFEVLEVMPWNPKRVKQRLGSLKAGVVEVKTRDRVVDPDKEQRRLRGSGDALLTVFVYRFEDRFKALITKRHTRFGCV